METGSKRKKQAPANFIRFWILEKGRQILEKMRGEIKWNQ